MGVFNEDLARGLVASSPRTLFSHTHAVGRTFEKVGV